MPPRHASWHVAREDDQHLLSQASTSNKRIGAASVDDRDMLQIAGVPAGKITLTLSANNPLVTPAMQIVTV